MKVFLTGATGYIGSAVAERLESGGHEVVGLARSRESAEALESRGFGALRASLTDDKALREAARAADGVIHAAATGGPDQAETDTRAVGTLLEALEGSGKPLVYTSGVWVLGDTGDAVADEETPSKAAELVSWRPAVEERVLAADLRGVVIRPAVVYGRGGGIPALFVNWGRKRGAVPTIGDGSQRWPAVHVDDLADLYVRALEEAPAGTRLHAADGSAHTLREIAEAASHAAGVPGKVEPWPLESAREKLGAFADALALDQRMSADRARTLLGWQPSRPDILKDLSQGSYAD
ncbi:MAG: SDR family oxidoreductase [Thermoanaerobaculia bacterium]